MSHAVGDKPRIGGAPAQGAPLRRIQDASDALPTR
jgi:hypothetical protein